MADKKRQSRAKSANEVAREAAAENAPAAEPALTTTGPPRAVQESPGPRDAASDDLFVVGVGASAGGLEAVSELLKHAPTDGIAFIVVQHLAPDHESMLTQLLSRSARMQVVTAADGMTIERNHAYVTPPNANLDVMHGVIRVIAPATSHGPRLPVDYLFRSLAQDLGQSAIGVVLSGTGTDGTLGVKAIKAAGGFTFAQDPSTAKYDGMPRSAIASGAVDSSLSPEEIGAELGRVTRRQRLRPVTRASEPAPQANDQLAKLFILLRREFGIDLTQYKRTTIDRRIDRRMALHKIERLEDYVRYVQENRRELAALHNDMLITVTSFFRDPEAFEVLKATVFPRLLEHKPPGQPIRVWVPACATGEEAYSLAIALVEFCEDNGRDERIQIFATDLDDDAIQYARRAVYPANIALDVSVDRLNRFFVKRDEEFVIARRIRDLLVFSRQNILADTPFSRMDLVSCRNLLIYLQPSAQQKVLRVAHYALNPSGYLMLGASETIGDAPELFSAVDRKQKIYLKKHVAPGLDRDLGLSSPAPMEKTREAAPAPPVPNLQSLADRKVLELYGPPGVVVNEKMEILQFRGRTGPFLDPAPGAASFNLMKVARPELHLELRKAVKSAISERQRITADVEFTADGKVNVVKLDVVPFQDPESRTPCLLVLFDATVRSRAGDATEAGSTAHSAGGGEPPVPSRVRDLERELAATREHLQTTIEERESTLQELKGANEELQSSNEELQSTNEELETSKEEMQSTNEELTTLNDELHSRMAELSVLNDDLHNVLSGVDNPVVIAGLDLKIRRYTAAAEKLFHLVPGDVGRSIGFLDTFLGSMSIEPKVSAVIQNLGTFEDEVLAANQRWYALKIQPYKTMDHSIRGALVTLVDVDVRRRAQLRTRDVGAYAAQFLAAISQPLLILDRNQRVVWANDAFLSTFQLTADETVGSVLPTIGSRQFADPALAEQLNRVFESAAIFRDFKMRVRLPDRVDLALRVGGSQVPASAESLLALVSIEVSRIDGG